MTKTPRQQLRALFRAKRRALSEQEQAKASQAIISQLNNHAFFQNTQHIALYLANDGEIDTAPVIQEAWRLGKHVYLPVLHPFYQKTLVFVNYTATTEMRSNRFGIPEPKVECPQLCPIQHLDVIFTPLVAFDAQGNRMGMGGGFYDRTLATLNTSKQKPKVIGLAHDCQQAEKIPTENWDIPLDAILTPSQWISDKSAKPNF
ncbi:5-formyltetrahydrofolate cyclo-ligase [Alteromonas sp. a30]|uniref:5-formyltetrahydrofolate cyclo-ligase n=1 Tax=Alteromonas sp. a30 TaxID=2730917 RepID=UPI002281F2A3|nr:5-formyltetrahydrofolate cyclo-ligase [Alteromonas sp. a30]MCY7296092.1 5-formyltetrahydrofolate cyclo-ligase [Alteromonas sp. a30]